MKVYIDEVGHECDGLLLINGSPTDWNGWIEPVFTTAQKDAVIAYGLAEGWDEPAEGWEEVEAGRWTVGGWCWFMTDEDWAEYYDEDGGK